MDSTRFTAFRDDLYRCFDQRRDALMNTCDALVSETAASTFVELCLSPLFPRQWPSLYGAVEEGVLDRGAFRKLLASEAPQPMTGGRPTWGIDASSIARPQSPTAKDRMSQYLHNIPKGAPPITYGWSFSALVVLPEQPGSWTYVLDNLRIGSGETASGVAAKQLSAIVPLWQQQGYSASEAGPSTPGEPPVTPGRLPLLLADRHYGSAAFVKATQGIACDLLLRISSDRVFYRAAPEKTGGRGAPRKEGDRFKCSDPRTHDTPDETALATDDRGRLIEVSRWKALHFKEHRDETLSVIRVVRHGALGTKRDPRVSWFIEVNRTGAPDLPLNEVPGLYARRFSQEHGYRFDKGPLLWETPRFRTPEQFQLWTDLVAAARDQLFLARPLVERDLRPWEDASRPVTPSQVRRAMGRFLAGLGTPARLPQPRGKSPGRPRGAQIQRAPRYSIVTKSSPSRMKPAWVAKKPAQKPAPTPAWTPPLWLIQALRSLPSNLSLLST